MTSGATKRLGVGLVGLILVAALAAHGLRVYRSNRAFSLSLSSPPGTTMIVRGQPVLSDLLLSIVPPYGECAVISETIRDPYPESDLSCWLPVLKSDVGATDILAAQWLTRSAWWMPGTRDRHRVVALGAIVLLQNGSSCPAIAIAFMPFENRGASSYFCRAVAFPGLQGKRVMLEIDQQSNRAWYEVMMAVPCCRGSGRLEAVEE